MKKSARRKLAKAGKVPVSIYLEPQLLEKVNRRVEEDGHSTISQTIARLLDRALAIDAPRELATATA